MIRYQLIEREHLRVGMQALLLYLEADGLSGALLERCCDGRWRRAPASRRGSSGIMQIIGLLLQGRVHTHVLVVLEPGAYWPDVFPPLERTGENNAMVASSLLATTKI